VPAANTIESLRPGYRGPHRGQVLELRLPIARWIRRVRAREESQLLLCAHHAELPRGLLYDDPRCEYPADAPSSRVDAADIRSDSTLHNQENTPDSISIGLRGIASQTITCALKPCNPARVNLKIDGPLPLTPKLFNCNRGQHHPNADNARVTAVHILCPYRNIFLRPHTINAIARLRLWRSFCFLKGLSGQLSVQGIHVCHKRGLKWLRTIVLSAETQQRSCSLCLQDGYGKPSPMP
jgi:hypothetical protein